MQSPQPYGGPVYFLRTVGPIPVNDWTRDFPVLAQKSDKLKKNDKNAAPLMDHIKLMDMLAKPLPAKPVPLPGKSSGGKPGAKSPSKGSSPAGGDADEEDDSDLILLL